MSNQPDDAPSAVPPTWGAPATATTAPDRPAPSPQFATPFPLEPPPMAAAVPPGHDVADPDRSTELLPTRAVRIAWIGGQIVSVPALFLGVGAVAVVAVTFATLPIWSAMAAVNLRRVRPATVHRAPPGPLSLALSWFAPVGVAVAAAVLAAVVGGLDDGRVGARASDELSVADVSVLVGVAGAVAVLVSLWVPYAAHRTAARWVAGDPQAFTRWFWAPILALIAASIAMPFLLRAVVDETSPEVSYAGVLTVLAVGTVPGIVYLVLGNRALARLEEATASVRFRRGGDAGRPGELTPAQVAALGGARPMPSR